MSNLATLGFQASINIYEQRDLLYLSRFLKSVKPCGLHSSSVSVLYWICALGSEAGKDIR